MAENAETEYFSEIELGKTYIDDVTGFVGIATQIVFTSEGATRVLLEARNSKENELGKADWFPEERLS